MGDAALLRRDRLWLWALVLIALAFAAYSPALDAGYIWDDDDYLTENPLIDQPGGLTRIWFSTDAPQYYPLYFTSFWLEHRLWGENPRGYHAVNILLHALNAFLAGMILRELKFRGAWWVALLFVLHPMHVESVAWITERKNTLSALFYLLSVWSYLRFDRTSVSRYGWGAGIAFVAALLSKTATFTAPFAIALLLFYRHRGLDRGHLARLAPMALLAVVVPWITLQVETGMVDAVRADFAWSFSDRLAIAGTAFFFYIWKTLVPWPLMFNYPRWDLAASTAAKVATAIPLALVGLLTVVQLFRGRLRPGPLLASATALTFYAMNVFPALGFFDVYAFRYSFVADHWNYLSSLGLLTLFAMAGAVLLKRIPRAAALGGGVALLAVLFALTWQQSHAYQDEETLWRHTLGKNPNSWIAHNNLATLLLGRGDLDPALEHYRAAVEAKPSSEESQTGVGLTLARLGRNDEALEALDQAVEINPAYPLSRFNRGELLREMGRHPAAVRDLTDFLDANPDHTPAYRSRAMAYVAMGQMGPALADATRAIELGAGVDGWNDRGGIRLLSGDFAGAVEDFSAALQERAGDTKLLANRAVAYARMGRFADARTDLDAVIAAGDAPGPAYQLRGRAILETTGDRNSACLDLAEACKRGDCRAFESICKP